MVEDAEEKKATGKNKKLVSRVSHIVELSCTSFFRIIIISKFLAHDNDFPAF